MIEIHLLRDLQAEELNRLTGPILCRDTYRVVWSDTDLSTGFTLELVPLETPHQHNYGHMDEDYIHQYLRPANFSFGAYEGDRLVGVLIAEQRDWNHSLWVWEFHVAPDRQGQGIGRQLMDHAAGQAREAGLHTIVCETQNRNSNAIKIYRRLGFQLEGIDISYYTNTDYPDHDVAVFMKRRLEP
jgi:streptothricin acetyltransferase